MRHISILALAIAFGAASVSSQAPSLAGQADRNATYAGAPDAALAGRAGAGTALSTGLGAAMSAPALLGASSGVQVLLPVNFVGRLQAGPIAPSDVRSAGDEWSLMEREAWLDKLDGGPWSLGAGASAGAIGLQVGRFALTVYHTVSADIFLPADAVEAALFGNSGRTGEPRDLALDGGGASAAAFTTVRVSHGRKVRSFPSGDLHLGLAADVRVLHAVASLPGTSGSVASDPLGANVTFTGRLADPDGGMSVGTQIRLSPSVAFVSEKWRAVGTVEGGYASSPAISGRVRRGVVNVTLSEDERTAETEDVVGNATDRIALESLVHSGRRLRVGAAYRARDRVWLAADVATAARDLGHARDGSFQASLGAEVRAFGPFHVRGGGQLAAGSLGYRAGLGVGLGPVTLDFGYGRTPGIGYEQVAIGMKIGTRQEQLFADPR